MKRGKRILAGSLAALVIIGAERILHDRESTTYTSPLKLLRSYERRTDHTPETFPHISRERNTLERGQLSPQSKKNIPEEKPANGFVMCYPFELDEVLPSPPIAVDLENILNLYQVEEFQPYLNDVVMKIIQESVSVERERYAAAKQRFEQAYALWKEEQGRRKSKVYREDDALREAMKLYCDERGNKKRLIDARASNFRIGMPCSVAVADPAEDLDLYWSYYNHVQTARILYERIKYILTH